MNPTRPALVFACALALQHAGDQPTAFASHVSPARAQEAATTRPSNQERPLAELLRAVEGEGRKDAEAWFRLGVAQDAAGDLDGALKSFRQALKLRPGFDTARAAVAHVLHEQGKLAEAEKEAVKAYGARVGTGETRMVAFGVLAAIRSGRQTQEAARELAQAERELAKKPDDPRWHLRKGMALLNTFTTPRRPQPFRFYLEERPATAPATSTAPPDEDTRRAAQAASRRRYEEAAASFDNYLRLKPDAEDRDFVLGQLEALRFYSRGDEAGAAEKVFITRDVTTKAVIRAKPDPGYTAEARKKNVSGNVRLRAVLAADGTVKYILVVKSLPHGLTEKAVEAARRIRFTPAALNGVPVSQSVTLEYYFNIY